MRKLLAEQMLDNVTLKELLTKNFWTPTAGRTAVSWAIEEKDYSHRRACALIGLAPKEIQVAL